MTCISLKVHLSIGLEMILVPKIFCYFSTRNEVNCVHLVNKRHSEITKAKTKNMKSRNKGYC